MINDESDLSHDAFSRFITVTYFQHFVQLIVGVVNI